jgi:hypothetical protein
MPNPISACLATARLPPPCQALPSTLALTAAPCRVLPWPPPPRLPLLANAILAHPRRTLAASPCRALPWPSPTAVPRQRDPCPSTTDPCCHAWPSGAEAVRTRPSPSGTAEPDHSDPMPSLAHPACPAIPRLTAPFRPDRAVAGPCCQALRWQTDPSHGLPGPGCPALPRQSLLTTPHPRRPASPNRPTRRPAPVPRRARQTNPCDGMHCRDVPGLPSHTMPTRSFACADCLAEPRPSPPRPSRPCRAVTADAQPMRAAACGAETAHPMPSLDGRRPTAMRAAACRAKPSQDGPTQTRFTPRPTRSNMAVTTCNP